MTRIFIVCGIIFLLFACKKDKLVGELAVFEGRWKMEWYVKEYYFPSIQYTGYDTVTVMTDSYEMEFAKKGKVRFYKNGEEVEKYRIQFTPIESSIYCDLVGVPGGKETSITLDNNDDKFIHTCFNSSIIRLSHNGFPLPPHKEDNADVSYRCFFKKQ